ncbi:MAG: glycerate kinase type-2 family protein [Anaerolineae bacterium]
MMPIQSFPTPLSPSEERLRQDAFRIIQAALREVDPVQAIRHHLRRDRDWLEVEGRVYDLGHFRRVWVVGGGKAGAPMAVAVEEILGDRLAGGVVNVKVGHVSPQPHKVEIMEAGHPVPDSRGEAGARRMLELAASLNEDDLLLCLISGGGSALLPLPAPGITLADKQALTQTLLRCGATINEMNAVRKHLSAIKGGQLARAAYPATVIACLLSDVVGSPLDVIASGPTVPDPNTYTDALAVLERYDVLEQTPPPVLERLRQGAAGAIPETPKPGDPAFERVQNVLVAENAAAAQAAVDEAVRLGYHALFLSTYVEGEAREVAKVFAGLGKEVVRSGRPVPCPACLVAGGETIVTVRGDGKGGRNQELALAAALALEGWEDVLVVGLATDGTDGPTDSAGAMASGSTVARARAQGLEPESFLRRNDSYPFFEALGDSLFLGPTGTNVNDLILVLVAAPGNPYRPGVPEPCSSR